MMVGVPDCVSTTIRTRLYPRPLPATARMSAEYWYDRVVMFFKLLALSPSASSTQPTPPVPVAAPPVLDAEVLPLLAAPLPRAASSLSTSAGSFSPSRQSSTARGAELTLIWPLTVLPDAVVRS